MPQQPPVSQVPDEAGVTLPNPFSPPEAKVEDVHESSIAVQRPPRPISAWILGLALVVMTVFLGIGIARLAWFVSTQQVQVVDPYKATLYVLWRGVAAVACVITVAGIFRRRGWSRWAGLCAIAAFVVWCLVRQDTTGYSNEAQQAGGWMAKYMFIPALCIWWAYAYGFSAKAVRYFSGPEA